MSRDVQRYLIRIYWSDDDEAYVAEAPALPGCVAHGATMQQAAKEMAVAMRLWLESARRHGDPIPEPDLAREEIERFAPIISVAKLHCSPARRPPLFPSASSARWDESTHAGEQAAA